MKLKLPVIDRVANSNILANLLSHDNPFNAKMGDLKAFLDDINHLEDLFFCKDDSCCTLVSTKYYDNVGNKIRCSCGKINYDWIK